MTEAPVNPNPPPMPKRPRSVAIMAGLALVILAGGAVLYEIAQPHSKQAAAIATKCAPERDLAMQLKPLVFGEVAALNLNPEPQPLPELSFTGPDGAKTSLAAFKDRLILLNLWATWCVPCRQEMPSLDKLEGQLGSEHFQVVPINIDTTRLERPKAFLSEIGVTHLGLYADSSADVFQNLKQTGKVVGLPTTILVGRDGCEIGTMAGPAKWDSPEAQALITAAAK